MTVNKAALSNIRAAKQEELDRRNPLNKIIEMVNYYHSIDSMDATEFEKQYAKIELKDMIRKKSYHVSPYIKRKIMNGLKNKNLWEEIRQELG